MTNPYYAQTGVPVAQSRGVSVSVKSEFGLVQAGFEGVNTQFGGKGNIAGQAWTGTHDYTGATLTMATPAPGDNSTKGATTAFVAAVQAVIVAMFPNYAPLNSPALTGTPTAPTATLGTNTTQIATMAALFAQAMSAALPGQSAATVDKVPVSDGTTVTWSDAVAVGSDVHLFNNYGG
ncbi:hypothetical protein ACO0LM_22975 [Undibacterium sp. Di26W]|uniref:hypothetical protein n=1 Tax=Undibacterium sp. Di26W TaxID=3413035 RepID=UPI003BF02384